MTLATTVALAVVRGPVAVAKTLGANHRLSGGRLLVAVGPGSSPEDYAAVGLDFSERWPRFDEAIGHYGRCGSPTVRRSSAASTRQRVFPWNPCLHNRTARRSGWVAGVLTPGFAAWPSGRRLAGVCLQHDARAVRRSVASTSLEAGRSREDFRHVPERSCDDVVLHHRRPRRSRPHPQRARRGHRAPARGHAPRTSPDRPP